MAFPLEKRSTVVTPPLPLSLQRHWRALCAPHRALHCRHDLEAIDFALVQSLSSIRDIHIRGVLTEEAFRDMSLGGFEVATADGRRVDLPTPGGASREVTQENRREFADMVEAFKMREYRVPVRRNHYLCLDVKSIARSWLFVLYDTAAVESNCVSIVWVRLCRRCVVHTALVVHFE